MIAECRLDIAGTKQQRDRYRALGRHATSAVREPRRLTVRFDAAVDVDMLSETIEVERRCCPFFEIQLHHERREVAFSVAHPEEDPALDAIADSVSRSSRPARR